MEFQFRINPLDARNSELIKPVEKTGDDSKSKNNQEFEEQYEEAKKKIDQLLKDKKIKEKLREAAIDVDEKTLKNLENTTISFLKNELLSITKDIFHLAANEISFELDEDLSLSDTLARFILKIAKSQNTNKKFNKSCKLPNVLEDKNAGYLVHICTDILNREIKCQKNQFQSRKLKKEDIINYFKSPKQ
jgi:NhaP-type Na+/H+ and K+/H+ antiporter